MDDVFSFKVGIGYGVEAVIEVEIPMSLYNKVCEWFGPETMARYEFGFHFQEILQDKFPEIAYSGDSRSPIPMISVHSVGDLLYRRQS